MPSHRSSGRSLRHVDHVLLPPARRTLVDDAEFAALPYPVRQFSWTELVEGSDFLSVHVPLAPTTRHLVDTSVLAAMKPTAILVNTARGPIVDESALVEVLGSGRLAGAGLDVYEHEPRFTPGSSISLTSSFCHMWEARPSRCGPGWPSCALTMQSPWVTVTSLRIVSIPRRGSEVDPHDMATSVSTSARCHAVKLCLAMRARQSSTSASR